MNYDPNYPDLIVLGSTGSVGEQAIDVARAHSIPVRGVTAHRSVETVEAQIREFHPDFAVLTDASAAADLRARVADTDTKVLVGFEGITEMLHTVKTENPLGITAENSILGEAGLLPTLETLKAGHKLALANKESLVVGGELDAAALTTMFTYTSQILMGLMNLSIVFVMMTMMMTVTVRTFAFMLEF